MVSIPDYTISKYDKNGKMMEESNYKPDGSLELKILCKYDEERNMIERTSSIYPIAKSKFDVREDNKSAMESANKEDFKYDDTGKVVEEINDISGDLRKAANKYDKYDKFANWFYKFKDDELDNSSSPKSNTER